MKELMFSLLIRMMICFLEGSFVVVCILGFSLVDSLMILLT